MFRAKRLLFALTCWVLAALGSLPAPAIAQTWPQRTVRFILPLGPGSGSDIGARLLAEIRRRGLERELDLDGAHPYVRLLEAQIALQLADLLGGGNEAGHEIILHGCGNRGGVTW